MRNNSLYVWKGLTFDSFIMRCSGVVFENYFHEMYMNDLSWIEQKRYKCLTDMNLEDLIFLEFYN
jgi:hypothetical protein